MTQIPAVTPAPGPNSGSGEKRQSNRDHIDQDAQTDLKKGLTTSGGTPGTPIPNNSNTPIPGIDVVVHKQPGGAITVNKTDPKGQLTFKQLEPGEYAVSCCDESTVPAAQFLTVSTLINGTLKSRQEFPAGRWTGKFTVSSAKDTIALKFERGVPQAGDSNKILRVINNSETDTATVDASFNRTAPGTGTGKPIPSNSNQPIPGIDVVVHKQPSDGTGLTQTTDGKGQLTFKQLALGRYEVKLPATLQRQLASGATVSMTTFVNGAPQVRTIIPVGSSVGTFEVANPRDTIVLEFKTNLGQVPTNGTGGTGGGR